MSKILYNDSGKKTCFLFAGINGSGKTSLYNSTNITEKLGVRVSIDEIARSLGDWRSTLVQVRAGRIAINKINECIEKGLTFNQETTLPGATIVRQLQKAKEHGFQTVLYFVGVKSVDIAIERVHKRIANGGHGIDDKVILKRWKDMPQNVQKVLPLCDIAHFYDNTEKFEQIATICQGELVTAAPELPYWFTEITGIISVID